MVGSDYCITTSKLEGFGLSYMEPWLTGTPVAGRNLPNITSDLIASGMRFPALYKGIEVPGKHTDFKDLTDQEQRKLISSLLQNKDKRELVNPEVVDNNRSVILTKYSLGNYANKLHAIYESYTG